MPIKLIQVQRKLNVGLSTIVEFLHKKGHDVEENPNTKIDEMQYGLLLQEFGKDLPVDGRDREQEHQDAERLRAEMAAKKEIKARAMAESETKAPEIETVIPVESRPKIIIKGHIDLDEISGNRREQPTVKPAVEVPAQPQKVESKLVEKVEPKPVQQEEVKPEPVKEKIPEVKVEPKVEVVEPKKVEVPEKKVEVEAATPKVEQEKKPVEVKEEQKSVAPVKPVEPVKENPKENPKESPKETPKEAPKETPKVEAPSVKEEVPTPKAEVQQPGTEGDEVYRINTKFESNIKVVDKIDLSAINLSTRPRRKTKEERKKERDDKHAAFHPAQGNPAANHPRRDGAPFPQQQNNNNPGAPAAARPTDADGKKKRHRIKKERVDVNTTPGVNPRPNFRNDRNNNNNNNNDRFDRKPHLKKPKAEVNDDDVQKQIKETLARLTSKNNKSNKGAKYRRDKRDAAVKREHEQEVEAERESKILKLTEFVTANDLANMMNVPVTKVIGTCMNLGIIVSINQRLDAETINIVADEFGFKTEYVSADVVEAIKADGTEDDNEEDWVPRPPIITVMGHVDHGKTSLLDNIRSSNVIAGEAGGITQHIGAYNVTLPNGRHITFLDTPGHEAFTAMRARGAKMTDIAIIIVAADDSVMPQTVEAINHASAAGVPIVFAINKIDKPHANPDKIKEELANMNYLVEDWGGKYQSQEISAKKGIGVNELLDKVLLEADLLDLKANPKKKAVGTIIESALDKGRGYTSTILVENGTLHVGDIVIAGIHQGRIKAMFNERNQRIEQAGPSEPALILGLSGAPQAGDTFNVLDSEQEAREIANRREQLQRELGIRTHKILTLDDIGRRIAIGNFQELNIIVKGDVDGSVEALSDSLIKLSTEEIQVNVIHKAVGQISESDVVLAAASNAIIIGFQVRPAAQARKQAENEGVEIRLYSIIYDAIEEVKNAMEGMLSPEIKEEVTANVEVQQAFKISKVGTIAGCIVRDGKIRRTSKVRVIRDGIVIHTGELGSLKRYKDDVKEVVSGQECGLNINDFNDVQVGDIIEAFDEKEIKKTL